MGGESRLGWGEETKWVWRERNAGMSSGRFKLCRRGLTKVGAW